MSLVVARFSTNSTLDPRHDPNSWLGRLTWQSDAPADLTGPAIAGDWKKFIKRWRKRLPDPSALTEMDRFGASDLSSSNSQRISILLQQDHSASPAIVEWATGLLDAVIASPCRAGSGSSGPKFRAANCPWIGGIESAASLRNDSHREDELKGGDSQRLVVGVTRPAATLPQSPLELSLLCDVLLFCGSTLTASQCWDVWSAVAQGLLSWPSTLDEVACDPRTDITSTMGELFWKFGLLFEGLEAADRFRAAGGTFLRELLNRITDEHGRPVASSLGTLAADLGLFLRMVAWGDLFAQPLFVEADRLRWEQWIVSAAALMTNEARLLTDPRKNRVDSDPWNAPMDIDLLARRIDLSAALAGLQADSRVRLSLASASGLDDVVRARSPLSRKLRRKLTKAKKESSRPSFQSEGGSFALLRTDWLPEASSLAVSYDSPIPMLHLALEGTPFFQGPWEITVAVEGQELPLAGTWDSVCWFTDEDVDYLELQQKLPSGVHLERQIVLSRTGKFLILADCVSRATGALEYRSRLPLVPEVSSTAEIATRECRVVHHETTARVIPAGLACERLHSTGGSLEFLEGGLELRQSGSGGLLAPLLIDWHPDRNQDQADWKSLVVTEAGLKLPAEQASGHRVRIGPRQQILIYRAVRRGEGLRAVMGYHTGNETVIARLKKNGDFEPVLLVE